MRAAQREKNNEQEAQNCIEAAIAQLAARRSHNPKVVSSILTRRIFSDAACCQARMLICAAIWLAELHGHPIGVAPFPISFWGPRFHHRSKGQATVKNFGRCRLELAR